MLRGGSWGALSPGRPLGSVAPEPGQCCSCAREGVTGGGLTEQPCAHLLFMEEERVTHVTFQW